MGSDNRPAFRPIPSAERRLAPAAPGVEHAVAIDLANWEESSLGDAMHKLILVRSGQVVLEGRAGRWFIIPGHLLFLPAARPYIFRIGSATGLTILYLDPARTDWHHEGCWVTRSSPLAVEMMTHAAGWRARAADSEPVKAFVHAIRHLCRDWFSKPRILWLPTARSTVMLRVIDLAGRDLGGASAASLAAAASISVSTLQRHCLDELGMGWRAFLCEMRMTRAMELLVCHDLPVAEVALAVGFKSVGSFTAAFSRRVGMRPRDFQRAYRSDCATSV